MQFTERRVMLLRFDRKPLEQFCLDYSSPEQQTACLLFLCSCWVDYRNKAGMKWLSKAKHDAQLKALNERDHAAALKLFPIDRIWTLFRVKTLAVIEPVRTLLEDNFLILSFLQGKS